MIMIGRIAYVAAGLLALAAFCVLAGVIFDIEYGEGLLAKTLRWLDSRPRAELAPGSQSVLGGLWSPSKDEPSVGEILQPPARGPFASGNAIPGADSPPVGRSREGDGATQQEGASAGAVLNVPSWTPEIQLGDGSGTRELIYPTPPLLSEGDGIRQGGVVVRRIYVEETIWLVRPDSSEVRNERRSSVTTEVR